MSRRIKKKVKQTDYDRLAVAIDFYREKIGLISHEALVVFNDILADFAKRLGEVSMRKVKYESSIDLDLNHSIMYKFDRGSLAMASTKEDHGCSAWIDMSEEDDKYMSMLEYLLKHQFSTIDDARKHLNGQEDLFGKYMAYHRASGENFELVSYFMHDSEDPEPTDDDIILHCVLMVGGYVILFSFTEKRNVAA